MLIIIEIPDAVFNEINDQCLHTSDGSVSAADVILEAAKSKFPTSGETFRPVYISDRDTLREYGLLP